MATLVSEIAPNEKKSDLQEMFLVYLKLCDDDELEYDDYQKETDKCRKHIPISSVKYKHVIPEIERLKWKEVLPVNDEK